MKARFIFFFIFISSIASIVGEELVPVPSRKLIFEENKNQWPKQVLFEADFGGGKLFLEKNTFTYLLIESVNFHDFKKKEKDLPLIHYHSFKVNFLNSNSTVNITGANPYSFQRNYYLGDNPRNWGEGVSLYAEVVYKDLYPSIDMNVYNTEQNLKYDLIVNPGGDPENIKLEYSGADKMYLKEGNLYIQTSLGMVVEQKPFAYQVIDGIKKEISCSYKLKKNVLGFSLNERYDKNYPLVIDPVLVASTYSGSFADNWGFTATYDDAGNIYSAGIASTAGYPTTLGAWDNTFNGGMQWPWFSNANTWPFDISITKYNATGSTILFSTYYGGSQNEQPHSLFVNKNNELYVTGRTNSPNFPSTGGAYDVSYNGGYDIIVGKFSSTGALLGSTFVGGTNDDGVNVYADESTFGSLKFNYADDGRSEIILDNSSNVYVAGSTRSSDFPASPGAYDATLGGNQDGCVFKMNSSLTALTFSTYLGGSNDDAAYGLKLDGTSNVYVTGGTISPDFPTTAGVLHTTFQGGLADGYITAINSSGTAILYSTYLGTSSYDQSYLIEMDANNDVYVYGQTKGSYLVTPGVYSNPNSSQFIHKMNKELNTTLFSTVIGTGSSDPNISPTAFLVDSCQSIYIAGWGRCSLFGHPFPSTVTGMPITSNAYQSTTDGCDFYFMVLRPNAQSLLYATFFGENGTPVPDHLDGGTSRFDKRGFIYEAACASCWGNDNFPTTPTAWSKHNNSTYYGYYQPWNCNNAVFKIDLRVQPDAIANLSGSPQGCVPFTVPFSMTGSQGTDFKWDFGDGSPQVSIASPSHTYTSVGTYTASLYVSDSTGTCGQKDSAKITIKVGAAPTVATSQTPVFCSGGNNGTATVTASGGLTPYSYLWSAGGQTSATAVGLSAGTYTITVTNSYGCSASTSATVIQPAVLSATTTFTNVGCYGGSNGTATATVAGGTAPYTYLWLPGGGTSSSVTGLSIGAYTVTVTDFNGCTVSGSANITQPPVLSITATPTAANCGQSNGSAIVSGGGGFAPYTWTWSGGQATATVAGLAAGTYTVTIHDANLCVSSLPVSIANTSGPSASIVSTNVSCYGKNDGSATITTIGGTMPFSYLWNNGQTTPTASNLAAGIYSVIVTDINNCSATASITITEPSVLSANAVGTNPSCFGFSDGSVLVSVLGGTSPYQYAWAITGSPTTSVVNGLGVGSYNVSVTDAKGCIEQAAVTLTNPNPVTTFISTTNVSCVGSCNGTATATPANGFAPYFYVWSDPAAQATAGAVNLCTGTYSVAVTDAHGCSSNAAATIGVSAALNFSFASIGNVSCFGVCDGFAQITPSGGTPPYSYNWMPGGLTASTVTGLCAGAFTCTITDARGCTITATDSITQPDQLVGSVNVTRLPCNGVCNGEIITTYSGGKPPYNYLWLPGLQITNNPSTLCAGSNTVTVTDANGCSASGAIELTSPPPLTISTSTTSSNCGQPNGGACVTATGGTLDYRYLWSSSAADTLDCLSGVVASTYTITVTDGMGCSAIGTAHVNDITGPIVAIVSSTDVTCFGLNDGTAVSSIAGGITPYSLLWSPGAQTVQNPGNLSAGINTLTITDNAGCVGSASVTIGTPSEIVSAITGVQKISCYGVCDAAATVLYGGGTGSLSIVWDSPGFPTTSTVTGLCAGTYHITITDALGCVKIDSSAVINQPPALVIPASTVSNITCYGEDNGIISAAVAGGTPYYTFNWTPNVSNSATAANLVAGSYSLNITDMKGCIINQSWSIIEPAVLSVSNSSNAASCSSDNGDATVIPAGGTSPYRYQWNDINIQTTVTAQNLYSGSYVCVVIDTNGCSITDTITVTEIPGPMIDTITVIPALCNGGNSGTAQVFPTVGMGAPPLNYLWTPSSQTTATAINLGQGAHSVVITDANGCVVNGIAVINQPAPLSINVSPVDTLCYGDTAQIYAQAVGGTPNYSYFWAGASGAGLTGTGPHLVTPTSTTTYTVNVSDANGCSAGPVSMQLIVPPRLLVTASPNQTICDGDNATLSVSASGGNGSPYNYLWSNGATTLSQVVTPSVASSPVSYIVTVNDGCSQPVSDTTVVIVQASPTGSFTSSTISGCEPLTVSFNAVSGNAGATYTWSFGDGALGAGSTVSHTYLTDNVYTATLTITSAAGCTSAVGNTSVITVNPLPDAAFSADPNPVSSLNPIVNFTDLSTITISSWLWNFNDSTSTSNISMLQNPMHVYSGIGIYNAQLIVTNQYGCRDTAYNEIIVGAEIIFPNAFTPNSDGPSGGAYDINNLDNNIFFPYTSGVIDFEIQIFNRWGELIFESFDIKKGWDGYYRSKLCQEGVYIWKARVKLINGKTYNKTGDVTLLSMD
ncbi:MAG: PKD domain-containing protein [Bacteroidota bacterium]